MAGDWLKWSKGLATRPEVVSIARELSIDRRIVPTQLMQFWEWCDENCDPKRGTARAVDGAFVDHLVGVEGFARAMENAGWLVISDDGIRIPHWQRHNGKPAKQRALHAEKMRRLRADARGTKSSRKSVREEKSREEEKREETPAPPTRSGSRCDISAFTGPAPGPGAAPQPEAGPGRLPIERFIQLFLLRHCEAFGFAGDSIERQRDALTAVAVRMFQHPDRDDCLRESVELAREKRAAGMRSPIRAWQAVMNRRYPKPSKGAA